MKTCVLYLLDECESWFRTGNHGLYFHLCTSLDFFYYYLAVGASAGRNGVRAARFCKRCTKTAFSSSISSILLTFFFFVFEKGAQTYTKLRS